MNRLAYVIVFTKRFEAMQKFYAEGLGLELRGSLDGWAEFDTHGAHLAVHEMDDDERQGVMLRFESSNLVRDMATLLGRGARFDGDVIEFGAGRLVNLWDPEDNLLTLFEPSEPIHAGLGPAIGTVIMNCEDFPIAVAFYRDTLGLAIVHESEHAVEFDTGLSRLALHRRPMNGAHPLHADQPLAWTIETDDLGATRETVRARGLDFVTEAANAEFGAYAELRDPDGRIVLLHEHHEDVSISEQLAEGFEDDSAPRLTPIRRPVVKATKSVSRLVNKPGYKSKKRAAKKRGATKPAKRAAPKRIASTRGAGAGHARLKPRTTRGATRAKVKPATGRLKKAVRRSAVRKKTAMAKASRSKPVKRASANRGRTGR